MSVSLVELGIFQDRRHAVPQLGAPFGEDDATLQQKSANLINESRAPMYQAIPHPVQLDEAWA